METTCRSVHGSLGIKQLLSVAMAVGNHVNDGSRRGGAYGFKFDSLLKMRDVKACDDNKYTLMHFMVETCAENVKQYGHALGLPGMELDTVGEASRISMSQLIEDLSSLRLSKLLLQREVKENHGAAFHNKMVPLLEKIVIPTYEKLMKRLEIMKKETDSLIERFGEVTKDFSIDLFFSLLKKTLQAWSGCKTDLVLAREKIVAEEKKKNQREKKKTKKKMSQMDMQSALAAEMAKKLARRTATKGSGMKNPSKVSTKLHAHARRLSSKLNVEKLKK